MHEKKSINVVKNQAYEGNGKRRDVSLSHNSFVQHRKHLNGNISEQPFFFTSMEIVQGQKTERKNEKKIKGPLSTVPHNRKQNEWPDERVIFGWRGVLILRLISTVW